MATALVTGARVVGDDGLREADIAIEDGTITAVGADLAREADRRVDASGLVALPGVVDVHNHMHDAELFPEGIDFGSQTASAVAGGVTTVVELPTQTPVTTPAAFRAKRDRCEELAHVDFGLVAGNFEDGEVDAEGLLAAGTPDFKTFTAEPYLASDRAIIDLMEQVGAAGGAVRVHCENQAILDHAREGIDGDHPGVYMDSRPLEAELEAINRAGNLAAYADCPLHVVHISSGSGAREAARIDETRDVPVTLETCPHYLAFSKADVADQGPFLKVNPSLKSDAEREKLWDAVADGTIDLIASEHFPTYRENREKGWEDIWEPYAGLPTIETTLEFLVSEGVHEGRISWARLQDLLCETPAAVAGLAERKGTIEEGADADLVLLRETDWTVSADDLAYNGNWTPFEGRQLSAKVDTVISGGEVASEGHAVRADPGDGEFLPRGPAY
jgi:dihydropyrimidinase/dihydroorotase